MAVMIPTPRHFLCATLAFFAFLASACNSSPPPPPASSDPPPNAPWFEDVTEKLGISFRHRAGPTNGYFMPQVMGSGVAVLDANNDDRLDLLLLQNAGPNSGIGHELYLQNANGTFHNASEGSGLNVAGHGMGVAVGDIDNDGWVDVYISQYGGGKLFRNRGQDAGDKWLGYEDVTVKAGVEQPLWGMSCSYFDFDRDGWLDLVVVNYLDYNPSHPCIPGSGRTDFCHPNQFRGVPAKLFHNRGRDAAGKWLGYEDVSVQSGLAALPSNGLGVVCSDFDEDGWPDVFVANDSRENHLWMNQRNGTFLEEAVRRGVAYDGAGRPPANMGVALADAQGSGRFDLFVTHLSEEIHTLWRQDAPGQFRDATSAVGLANPTWRGTGFGTIAIDFDHDGALDLAVVNGRVSRARVASTNVRADLPEFWKVYAERNQLFQGVKGGWFRDVSPVHPEFAGQADVMRGLAWGDLDRDGAIDLVGSCIEGPVRVYRNIAPKAGHWLIVRPFDPKLTRDALGARVTVRAGDRTWSAAANPGQSYCSSGAPYAHFGLGDHTIDEVRVDWPDGSRETFPGRAVDRFLTLEKGNGRKP